MVENIELNCFENNEVFLKYIKDNEFKLSCTLGRMLKGDKSYCLNNKNNNIYSIIGGDKT